jgi:hypothetical protein
MDWDVVKAKELMEAMMKAKTMEELKDIGNGIAFLPKSVLSDERRAWLRDIYSSCVVSIKRGGFDNSHLTEKGKKFMEGIKDGEI